MPYDAVFQTKKHWEIDGESFPTVFEVFKTVTTAENYDPLNLVKPKGRINVDIGEKSQHFCLETRKIPWG